LTTADKRLAEALKLELETPGAEMPPQQFAAVATVEGDAYNLQQDERIRLTTTSVTLMTSGKCSGGSSERLFTKATLSGLLDEIRTTGEHRMPDGDAAIQHPGWDDDDASSSVKELWRLRPKKLAAGGTFTANIPELATLLSNLRIDAGVVEAPYRPRTATDDSFVVGVPAAADVAHPIWKNGALEALAGTKPGATVHLPGTTFHGGRLPVYTQGSVVAAADDGVAAAAAAAEEAVTMMGDAIGGMGE
jgi:hypothetical protein